MVPSNGLPRGIAAHNPGNLRPGVAWQGLCYSEDGYCRFESDITGIRAAALNLWAARFVHHRKTIPAIITAYAPPAENRTENYVRYMLDCMGVPYVKAEDYILHVEIPDVTERFLQDQFVFENGHPPFGHRSWPHWYCTRTMDLALQSAGHWPGIKISAEDANAAD